MEIRVSRFGYRNKWCVLLSKFFRVPKACSSVPFQRQFAVPVLFLVWKCFLVRPVPFQTVLVLCIFCNELLPLSRCL